MRVLVVGAGAIGSVLGGFLAKAGHDVTLVGRAWHLDVIRRDGLAMTGIWGEHSVRNLTTATSLEAVDRLAEFAWIFVCVKAHQTAEVAETLAPVLGPSTLVCAFQNGLGNFEALTRHLPLSRIALGRVIFGVEIEPGRVQVTVCADDVVLGAPDPQFPRAALAPLATTLTASGIRTRTTPDILKVLWAKALYNCALNGLSTLLEAPYGKLSEQGTTRRLMEAIIDEAYRVAAAHHIPLEPSTSQAYQTLLFTQLIPSTAAHRSSMLQDVRRGKRTEIDALNGAIVRMAQPVGVPVPVNALITRLVHTKESFSGVP